MVIGYIFVSGNSGRVVCSITGLVFRRGDSFCRLPKSLCEGSEGTRRVCLVNVSRKGCWSLAVTREYLGGLVLSKPSPPF